MWEDVMCCVMIMANDNEISQNSWCFKNLQFLCDKWSSQEDIQVLHVLILAVLGFKDL